jgi:cation diffusion facilitator family transporter
MTFFPLHPAIRRVSTTYTVAAAQPSYPFADANATGSAEWRRYPAAMARGHPRRKDGGLQGHGPHGGHGHDHGVVDRAAWGSADGIRAIKVSTFGLAATAAVQFAIAALGGSVALLADGLHNLGDVFTTVALWVAFRASRRAADRRYTFGYHRFEDLAGVGIVAIIALTAAAAAYESYRAILRPRPVGHLALSMAAAVVGIIGNEAVAEYKIRIGRSIHSVALEADGIHSRIDGFVSAGALVGLFGVALGYPPADPIAGLAITAVIVWVTIGTARGVILRVVDAVDPELIEDIERSAQAVAGVIDSHDVQARWAGRSLLVNLHVSLDEDLPLHEAHGIGEDVRHAILHDVDGVAQVNVHFDPWAEGSDDAHYHRATAHHFGDGPDGGEHPHDEGHPHRDHRDHAHHDHSHHHG